MRLSFILKSVSDLPTEPEEINLKIKRNYPLFQNPFPISKVKSVSKFLFLCLFRFLCSMTILTVFRILTRLVLLQRCERIDGPN